MKYIYINPIWHVKCFSRIDTSMMEVDYADMEACFRNILLILPVHRFNHHFQKARDQGENAHRERENVTSRL